MSQSIEKHEFVVVGGGPAGLSAALTASSEHIDTLVLVSSTGLGGQAATSSMIENYPGRLQATGADLTGTMVDQALGFGTEFMGPVLIDEIIANDEGFECISNDNESYLGRYALIATGVEWRKLTARNLPAYLGRGVDYGSPSTLQDYSGLRVSVVGGGNSAGQAAVHLSSFDACNVDMLIRSESLEESMSGYLIDKIRKRENITVHTESTLTAVGGNGRLEDITVNHRGDIIKQMTNRVFILIGSIPKTNWLKDTVERDETGFILTGMTMSSEMRDDFQTRAGRPPFSLETSQPGLFVAGDVRSGATRRIPPAVSDGVNVVADLHKLRSIYS